MTTQPQDSYQIIINGTTRDHPDYASAIAAWEKIGQACNQGRSIDAELWRFTRYPWDKVFYQGLQDPVTGEVDPETVLAVPGVAIQVKHCIAALYS
jgi:hypothetical protein